MDQPLKDAPANELFGVKTVQNTEILQQYPVWLEHEKVSRKSSVRAFEVSTASGFKLRLECGCLRTVGRAREVDAPIPSDGMLSRMHMIFECTVEHAIVRDLGSTNGTFVNGKRIRSAQLNDGDQIIAGSTVFSVTVEYEAS